MPPESTRNHSRSSPPARSMRANRPRIGPVQSKQMYTKCRGATHEQPLWADRQAYRQREVIADSRKPRMQ